MTEKRFQLNKDSEWWTVKDNTIKVNELGYREDLTGEDAYRGLGQELTEQETVDLLNELYEENQSVKDIINELNSMDFYRDSALLDEYIGKIASAVGCEWE